jgi:hypothetical protein
MVAPLTLSVASTRTSQSLSCGETVDRALYPEAGVEYTHWGRYTVIVDWVGGVLPPAAEGL